MNEDTPPGQDPSENACTDWNPNNPIVIGMIDGTPDPAQPELPEVTRDVIITAGNQHTLQGDFGIPLIEVQGILTASSANGITLNVQSASAAPEDHISWINGLIINGFTGNAIEVMPGDEHNLNDNAFH